MASKTQPEFNPVLDNLANSVRAILATEFDQVRLAEHVARMLQPYLEGSDLLTPAEREPDPAHYRQHILHVEEDGSFSIVALVWLPSQSTPIHDHVTWCVVGVYEGQEYETRYQLDQEHGTDVLVETDQSINPTGSVAALTPPGIFTV